MTIRQILKRLLTPVALVFAVLYFVIDGLFFLVIEPISRRLARLPILLGLARWIKSLGPYPTLALFLVPILLLEPLKPIGAYLLAKHHPVTGTALLVLAEVLKVGLVERLFHLSRDKLMSIPAFARCYNFVMRWLAYLRSLPAWRAAEAVLERAKSWLRQLWRMIRP